MFPEIALRPELETALTALVQHKGISPEALAITPLRERFLPPEPQVTTLDDRTSVSAVVDCGVAGRSRSPQEFASG